MLLLKIAALLFIPPLIFSTPVFSQNSDTGHTTSDPTPAVEDKVPATTEVKGKAASKKTAKSKKEPVTEPGQFRFKVEEGTEDKGRSDFNFKVDDSPEAKPIVSLENDANFKTVFGYPRWELGVSYIPQIVAFRQTLANSKFEPNFSSTSNFGYALAARVLFTPNAFFEGEYSTFDVKSTGQAGSALSVEAKVVSVDSLMFRGFACHTFSKASHRFCGGLELGSDATPTLEFKDSATLQMTKIRDFVIGPSILYQYPPTNSLRMIGKLTYLHGLAIGQNDVLAVKSDTKVVAQGGFDFDMGEKSKWGFFVVYFMRNYSVEGVRGVTTEQWKVASSNVGARFSYSYSF